jgi:hypothetical protein
MKSITTLHHDLPMNVSKQIIKSLIGSLNATAIAYARGHLRYNAVENIADYVSRCPTSTPSTRRRTMSKKNSSSNTVVADGMGFEVQMQSGELAENLMRLRGYFAAFLEQHKAQQNDVPLSIAETVKFQMSRPSTNNDDMLEALADAVDIDVDMLKAAQLKMVTDDVADLKANAGKVVTYLEAFESYDKDAAGHVVAVCVEDETSIESMFDTLPAHVQYKLMFAAIARPRQGAAESRCRHSCVASSMQPATSRCSRAIAPRLNAWLGTFMLAKRTQLDAYMERGGVLPMLEDRTVVTADTKPLAAPQQAQAERSLRRAPRPAAVK